MSVAERRAVQPKMSADGTPIHALPEDITRQEAAGKIIEAALDCKLTNLGVFAPIDLWVSRNGQPIGVAEIKTRIYADDERYPSELLNIRKYNHLATHWLLTGQAAVFFSCAIHPDMAVIRYAAVQSIPADAKNWRIIGMRGGVVKSRNDVEPCLIIPHDHMKELWRGDPSEVSPK
ncbi:MAG: hypothetical protein VW405_07525 [Rhodospirillaceae bacterium]